MHPIVMFRMRNNRTLVVKNEMRTVENAKRDETYGTDTRDIRDDSYFKKKRIAQIKPPPLGMGGGGDLRIVLFCTLTFYVAVTNYPYVCFFTRRNIILS